MGVCDIPAEEAREEWQHTTANTVYTRTVAELGATRR